MNNLIPLSFQVENMAHTCGNILRRCISIGAHNSCCNMSISTSWTVLCQSEIRQLCIVVLQRNQEAMIYSLVNCSSLIASTGKICTESRRMLEALKSLQITCFSEKCRKARPRAAPSTIFSLRLQERGCMPPPPPPDHENLYNLSNLVHNSLNFFFKK